MSVSLSPSRFTAVRVACWLSAAGLLAVAGFLLFAPIGGNECPHLAKSLYYYSANSWCVGAGQVWALAGSVVGSIGAAGAAIVLGRRRGGELS